MNKVKYVLFITLLLYAGESGRVKGKVIDYDTKRSLKGTRIDIVGMEPSTTTDENGEYIIKYIPPGTYSFIASCLGYDTVEYNVSVAPNRITRFIFPLRRVEESPIEQVVDTARTNEYGAFTGEVTDEVSYEHLAGVEITVERSLRQNYRIIMYQVTNNKGKYIFRFVPVGSYKLVAKYFGYKHTIRENIIVEADKTTVLNFTMPWWDRTPMKIIKTDMPFPDIKPLPPSTDK